MRPIYGTVPVPAPTDTPSKATSRSRRAGTGYPTLWNAFKRIAASASPNEKRDLFAGTARQIYRLGDA